MVKFSDLILIGKGHLFSGGMIQLDRTILVPVSVGCFGITFCCKKTISKLYFQVQETKAMIEYGLQINIVILLSIILQFKLSFFDLWSKNTLTYLLTCLLT